LLLSCLLIAPLSGCAGILAHYTGEDTASEVRAIGLPAQATILRIWETGVRVNDNPVVGFLLEVRAEGREPWQAETRALVSILDIPQIQPGAVLEVLYDPDHPERVAIGQPQD
jgi:hypothetical protein